MRGSHSLTLALGTAVVALTACGGGGGSGSPDGSLEVVVAPVHFECEDEGTGVAHQTCRPLEGVAVVRCSPDEVSHELPAERSEPEVDAGEVCRRLDDDERLLAPAIGQSCARPRGRVTVAGKFDGEPIRLALRSCPGGGREADEWARLLGLPFADVPNE